MSAGILTRDVQFGTEMGWHKKTQVVELISKEVVREKFLYPFEKRRNFILDSQGNPIIRHLPVLDEDGEETGEFETDSVCDDYKIVSLDDMIPVGGSVKRGYQLITNEMIFDMVQTALAGSGYQIKSVGSIKNRSKCFISIKLSDDIVAGNRQTQNVLNVLWGHGGVFQVLAKSGFIVVVCQNTFNASLGEKSEFSFALKHTGKALLKLEKMTEAVDRHYGVVGEFKAAMDSLETQSCNADRAKSIFAGFLVRDGGTEALNVEEVSTRTSNCVDTLTTLFNKGEGNRGATLCDTFNAFTDFYSHLSSGGKDRYKQFASSEFGAGQKAKSEAYDLLTGRKVAKLGDLETVIKRGSKVLQLV